MSNPVELTVTTSGASESQSIEAFDIGSPFWSRTDAVSWAFCPTASRVTSVAFSEISVGTPGSELPPPQASRTRSRANVPQR
jgi:hypothetical protein